MRVRAVLAVAVPLFALLGWTGRLYAVRQTGIELVFPVRAYDPRDLLSGHYLRYQIDYGPVKMECPYSIGGTYCHCLEKDAQNNAKSLWFGACPQAPEDCALKLVGHCEYGQFTAGIERFYLNDQLGEAVRVPPEGAKVFVRLSSDGFAMPTDFRIQGKSIREWVNAQPKSQPVN